MRLTTLMSMLALALPPTAALTSTGCVCTLIGYDNGLAVRVSVPPEPAAYRIEVEAEGDILSLGFEATAELFPACVGECRIEGDRIELAPGHIGADHETLVVLVTRRGEDRGPSQATVRVYRAEALLAEGRFEPRYQTNEPNGRGCGKHVFASALLDVR